MKNFEHVTMQERINAFETAYISGGDYSIETLELAKAITASVLHTVRDPQRKRGNDKAKQIGVNTDKLNGYYNTVFDSMLAQLHDSKPTFNNTVNDVDDLVQTACVSILEEASKRLEYVGDFEREYQELKPSKKVIIGNDMPTLDEKTTTPIQQAYRAVRKAIDDEKSVKYNPANGYLYFSDLLTLESEDGETVETTLYHRAPKYYDIGSFAEDFNGKETVYTGSIEDLKTVESMLSALKLSAMQAQIVKYRMQGYGKKAICRALNIKDGSYNKQFQRIRAKAETAFPEMVKR